MRKRFFVKSVALLVCLVFVGITASGLFAAEKRSVRFDTRLLFKNPARFLTSVFPVFSSFYNAHKRQILAIDSPSANGVVKPTGELVMGRPSTRD
jgi:hypothetical protein